MTEQNKDLYTIKEDEAAIIIKPTGEVQVFMPHTDESEEGTISSDSPTFRAMVIMTFINDDELRTKAEEKLTENLSD
jgi:hypothetical protein